MNKVKPLIEPKLCEHCGLTMQVQKYYPQKRFCSAKCRSLTIPMPPRPDQTGSTPWNKGLSKCVDNRLAKMSENRKGNKNWQYKHGKSKSMRFMWQSSEHKLWRKTVFERDEYTCQICLSKGGELNADHIKCFAHHPNVRFDVDNGRTLCVPCHKLTPNYGYHKKEQCI